MSAPSKKKSLKDLINPAIRIEDNEHPLEIVYDNGKDLPIFKAIGFVRTPIKVKGQGNTYFSYTITFQGDKILSIDVEEPNLRGIAEEAAKISFVTTFTDQD